MIRMRSASMCAEWSDGYNTTSIQSKKQYWHDEHIYKERHLAESFFNKVKQFRRVFSRFDKYADSYMSFLHIAGTLIRLK